MEGGLPGLPPPMQLPSLGALSGKERSAIAAQLQESASVYRALAAVFKRKLKPAIKLKPKRAPTVYSQFMSAHMRSLKAEVRWRCSQRCMPDS